MEKTIIDNFLPEDIFKSIKSMFFRHDFPWFFAETTVKENIMSCNKLDNYQFHHTFYEHNQRVSNWNILPLIEYLKINAIVKIKANLNNRTEKIIKHGYHTDNKLDCKTAIYYVNSNNGFTEFDDGTIVESVENRVLIFNSKLFHTGTTCTNKKRRIVVNLNYF